MAFLIKKIISQFLNPLSLGFEILAVGVLCLWATKRQRFGKIFVTLGTLYLLLLSLSFVSGKLMTPLEERYPALLHPESTVARNSADAQVTKWIVVLGGGHVSDPRLPVTSQLSQAALGRVVEGVRLHKAIPESKLLLSGGGAYDPVPDADVMARVALLLGVKAQEITLERQSRDTEDQAALIAKVVGTDKIILVTSAAHMPRSMALFKKQGLQPVPAPADYLIKKSQGFDPGKYFPRAGRLEIAESAWHEYLGLAWAWLRGSI